MNSVLVEMGRLSLLRLQEAAAPRKKLAVQSKRGRNNNYNIPRISKETEVARGSLFRSGAGVPNRWRPAAESQESTTIIKYLKLALHHRCALALLALLAQQTKSASRAERCVRAATSVRPAFDIEFLRESQSSQRRWPCWCAGIDAMRRSSMAAV
jgi:hypothetical protein